MSGNLVAEARLSVDQMQDLYDQISALTKACVDFFGAEPTFSLRIEVDAKSQPLTEHIGKINQLLQEVSQELQLG
jgi:hypothetical protein